MKWYEKGEKIYSMSEEAGYMTEEVKRLYLYGRKSLCEYGPIRKESIVDVDAGLISMR